MRLFYVDPGLHNDLGHHANYCRFITKALRSRGIEPIVLAHARIQPTLQAELSAHAHFRGFTYYLTDGDPVCGWLNAFHSVSTATSNGLRRLDVAAEDLVYVNSAQSGVMMGVVRWLTELPADRVPRVVMEFATDPGLDVHKGPQGIVLRTRDPRIDARGALYRFTARQLPPERAGRLWLATFEPNSSSAYAALMGRPVGVLPFVHHATTRLRSRVGARPCTVSVIGHQRVEKGFGLMPDVVRILQASGEDIRLLIHNGDPREMADAQQAVRNLAATDARIRLDERVADPAIWSELLDASDLIVCPYEPSRYALSASAVASEAIANAIPVVVPGRTALSRLVREFGGPGTTFGGFDAVSVAAGVLEALRNFDQLAELAYLAAGRWAERFGPDRLVEAILAVGDPAAVDGTLSSAYPSAISVE